MSPSLPCKPLATPQEPAAGFEQRANKRQMLPMRRGEGFRDPTFAWEHVVADMPAIKSPQTGGAPSAPRSI